MNFAFTQCTPSLIKKNLRLLKICCFVRKIIPLFDESFYCLYKCLKGFFKICESVILNQVSAWKIISKHSIYCFYFSFSSWKYLNYISMNLHFRTKTNRKSHSWQQLKILITVWWDQGLRFNACTVYSSLFWTQRLCKRKQKQFVTQRCFL